ncbi:zinc ribbon domain-containing protein [Cellulomonas citrea]|uniref:zinc ribbon domain-containing protein n=1 Tax=Cellulomonas citrea TaxID=1909423 RepID=UPI00135B64D0|nr:C4-type zinc ribbon domain-containing protein [Cellulomonas citrea]
MTKAPAADQARLLAVQDLDTQLDQLAHRRRTTPELAVVAELDARLADLDAALVMSRTAANDLRRELKKAEADVEQVRSRAQRDQARLDSGAASVKDVQALSAELEHLAHRQTELEEVELEVMERLEAHESALGHEQSAYDDVVAQQVAARAAVEAALAQIDAQVAQVRTERAAAIAGLDAALVALYEKLRTQLSGRGAGRLVGNRCDGCRMELNPSDVHRISSADPDEVVRCEECGRILVRS